MPSINPGESLVSAPSQVEAEARLGCRWEGQTEFGQEGASTDRSVASGPLRTVARVQRALPRSRGHQSRELCSLEVANTGDEDRGTNSEYELKAPPAIGLSVDLRLHVCMPVA